MPILSSLSLVRYGTAKSEATHSKATFSEMVGRGLKGRPSIERLLFHSSVIVIITEEVTHVDVLPKLLSIRFLHRGSSARWKWKLGDT